MEADGSAHDAMESGAVTPSLQGLLMSPFEDGLFLVMV